MLPEFAVIFKVVTFMNSCSNQGCGVGFFVRLRKSNWIIFLHHTPKLGIPVEMVQFLMKLLLNERILAVYHDLH